MTKIRDNNGRPAIYIDGKVNTSPIAFIRTREKTENGVNLFFDKEYFKNLGESGIKIYFVSCNTFWIQENALEMFDKECRALLDAIPDAYIIARFGLHPPKEWLDENPDESVMYSNGERPKSHLWTESYETDYEGFYSLHSSKWREDAGKALEEVVKAIIKLPYSDHIIGFFPTAGNTSEWYTLPMVNKDKKICLDYGKAFKREFSAYLKQKYGNDENLKKAWNNKNATIDDPIIPDYNELYFTRELDYDMSIPKVKMLSNAPVPETFCNGTHIGSFTDMNNHMHVLDFLRAWHIGVAKSQIYFADILKKIAPDRIVGMCYGAQGASAPIESGTCGGTRMILESKSIDFLENPSVYENRQPGGFVGQRVVQDTFSLYNKIYVCQDDARTHAENSFYREKYQLYDMTDSINTLKRDYGKCICEGMSLWWFDQLLGGRRYKYKEIYDLFKKQDEITKEVYSLDMRKNSEIALIFDEESLQSASFKTTQELVEFLRNYELARVGAPMDQYYHNDMANPNMPSYKLYIFVNTVILSDDERKVIIEKLKRDNAVALWVYAPGFGNENADVKMSTKNMSDITGMTFDMINERCDATFRWNGEKHPINANFDDRSFYGKFSHKRMNHGAKLPDSINLDSFLYPQFFCNDDGAKHLAYFATNGKPAVSVKECDGYTSVYYGSKSLRYNVIREIARFAGVHIYSESDDVIYVGRNYITFHSSQTGKKTIKFSEKVNLYEVYEDKYYGKNTDTVEFEIKFGETKMFRIERQ